MKLKRSSTSTLTWILCNWSEKPSASTDKEYLSLKVLASSYSKKKNSKCTITNSYTSSKNMSVSLERSNQSAKICWRLTLQTWSSSFTPECQPLLGHRWTLTPTSTTFTRDWISLNSWSLTWMTSSKTECRTTWKTYHEYLWSHFLLTTSLLLFRPSSALSRSTSTRKETILQAKIYK